MRGERGLKPVNNAECDTYNELHLNISTRCFKPNVSVDGNGILGGAFPFFNRNKTHGTNQKTYIYLL